MKNENALNNIFLSSLAGFPLGITLLLISYIGIYCIAGENTANLELAQLQNVKTLVYQMMSLGLAYFILFVHINTVIFFKGKKTTDFMYKHKFLTFLIFLVLTLCILVSFYLVFNENVFSKNVATVNCTIIAVMYAVCTVAFMIKDVFENLIVKKINIKIQERNKDI